MDGLSTSRNCESMGDCLVQAGMQFVIRYHSRTTKLSEKRLSPREAALLSRAGLDLVTVYQDNARAPEDFGLARGLLDGRSAFAFASQVGQPPGSAIYFAVDTDFSSAEIQNLVLPYFEGVRSGLDEAAGGSSRFAIGVYGSGLTCQLVRENHALAQLSWLALATGWRGSASYSTWSIRQHGPAGPLCGLGLQWERNETRAAFGQFRPIGGEVAAAEGASMRVTAPELFLRRIPSTQGNVPIGRMTEGQLVRVLGEADPPWLRVRVTMGGSDAIGYASAKFLARVAATADGSPTVTAPPVGTPSASAGPATTAVSPTAVPPVHYRENDPGSQRSSTGKRAQPLGEAGQPRRSEQADSPTLAAELNAIVDWLAVDSSARYRRDTVTYCNVYAADFCYLASAYLPRAWWTEGALLRIAAGDIPEVLYGTTIREMRADDLLSWLIEFGPAFGWRRVFDLTALQAAANSGGIGIACADRAAPGPGHITIVVPESTSAAAQRDPDGNVTSPLQSQAGAGNFRRSVTRDWWNDGIYRDRGFFSHA